ncbi:MAG: VOC family protein [Chitinophagaceae bacterium]|nr:VOC family protein [Anaerolineae bacterium]
MNIDRIDHFVLTVRDVQTTCDFYARVLGMSVISFGEGRKALRFGSQKINLHQAGKEFEPKASTPTPGAADFCLITSSPIEEVYAQLKNNHVSALMPPSERDGATGKIRSVYFHDPDGNLVEVANTP